MTRRSPAEAIGTADPVEGMARALVLALFPMLAAALRRGVIYRQAAEQAISAEAPAWIERYGQPVADRAAAALRSINCATVLTPYGLELWMREYPVEAIPKLTPPEASVSPRVSLLRRAMRRMRLI